jgi:hypothetical protein
MTVATSSIDAKRVKFILPRKSFKLFDSTNVSEDAGYSIDAIPTIGYPSPSSHASS